MKDLLSQEQEKRGLWYRVFRSMTRGVDLRGVLIRSSILASASTLFTLPYFHYLVFKVPHGIHQPGVRSNELILVTQLALLFVLCLSSAMVGLTFSRRLKLPGFGDVRSLLRSLPLLILLAGGMISLSYLLFDRHFIPIAPASYPREPIYLYSLPLKGAFTEEIILRLCLVTVGIYLLKNRIAGVVVISFLGALLTMKFFHYIGIEPNLNMLFLKQFTLSLLANLLLGYLFVAKGLLYAMTLKFMFGLKYLVLFWIMG